jgi:hypothetical protein
MHVRLGGALEFVEEGSLQAEIMRLKQKYGEFQGARHGCDVADTNQARSHGSGCRWG